MASNNRRPREAVGTAGNGPEVILNPQLVRAQRAPNNQDFREIGTLWIDIPNDAVYMLTSIIANTANWQLLT